MTASLLTAAAMVTVAPAAQAASTSPAAAAPAAKAAKNGCTGFQDDFAADFPGSLNTSIWDQSGAVAQAIGQKLGTPLVAPTVGALTRQGWQSDTGGFSALQSVSSCSGAFTFSTVFKGDASSNNFEISLVSADLSQAVTVEGNANNTALRGIWAGPSLQPAGGSVPQAYTLSPHVSHESYAAEITVNGSGNATVTLSNDHSGQVLGTATAIPVGTGPLFVVLGEDPGGVVWQSASLVSQSGPPPSLTVSLTAATPTVAAVQTVPASAVPASDLSGAQNVAGSDVTSAPLSDIPLSDIPLSDIPLSDIPLSDIAQQATSTDTGLAGAAAALANVALSDLTVTFPPGCTGSTCSGWQGVLAGSTLSGLPLQSVTLAQVLTNSVASANFDSSGMNLGDLGLSSSALSSLPLSSIPLSDIPLSDIPLDGTPPAPTGTQVLDTWCSTLSTLGFTCSSFGVDPANPSSSSSVTLLTLALDGVPLSDIPLSDIPLSDIPLSDIPLSDIPLSDIPLSDIPLSDIPLSDISTLATVVNCTGAFSCTGATLGQAFTAGALQAGVTLGQLVADLTNPSTITGFTSTTLADVLVGDNTSAPDFPALTLGDLLLSLEPPSSYAWQDVNLANVPLAQDESAGGTEQYTVPLDLSGPGATVQLSVTLPPTFAYVAGSATIDGAAAPVPNPLTPLTWSLPLAAGSHTFSFSANAGINLGPATATVAASVGSSAAVPASTTVNVVDGEEPDSTLATATPLAPNTLNLGFMTSATDVNDWAITVTQDQELSLALTNLPAQYDLELFAPATAPLAGTPAQQLSGVDDTVPALSPNGIVEATPGSQDIPVAPPPGYQLDALSNVSAAASGYTGTDAGAQFIQTPPLAAGTYIVQVSGYNGATSPQPYLLRAQLLGGNPVLSCPPLSFPNSEPAPPASAPTVAPGVNTLFLVDTQRMAAEFGASAESTVMTDLQAVSSDSAAGVSGAIIPVDAFSPVQAAYTTWDADPCSVQAANGVVSAISAVVASLRASDPSVTSIVIVGADDQIPFARLADGTVQANERDYGAGTFPGENNVEADALSDGFYFSDDPFASSSPLGVGSSTLYLPTAAVGRLVQSPDQGAGAIENALTRFVSSNGDINATAGLSTGYSFLSSGAELVSANLAGAGLTMSDLINETWTTAQLQSALEASPAPTVDSVNAHFDFYGALPAEGNTTSNQSDLFLTTAVSGDEGAYAGRLLFSMGCHAGLDINTLEVAASGIAPTPDWASTFADAGALWVANTGYGYGDSSDIAYSAAMMSDFAADIGQPVTIGQALAEAAQQYAAGNAILSPYDLKSIMEANLYGLPMYTLNGAAPAAAPATATASTSSAQALAAAPPATGTDPFTGLTDAQVDVSLPVGSAPGQLSEESGANGGSYFQVNGSSTLNGSTQTTEFRPIEPLDKVDVTQPSTTNPGQLALVAHGALVNALSSQDIAGFTPAISQPDVDTSTSPADLANQAFPGALQRVATYNTFASGASGPDEQQQLDLVAGQFVPDPSTPAEGTQRLYTKIGAEVLYTSPTSSLADDFTPPTIDTSNAVVGAGDTDFAVTVTPGESAAVVKRVLVLYTSAASPGTWTALDLASANGTTWSGAAPNPSGGAVDFMVEAVDAAGNVASSSNNGLGFTSSPAPSSGSSALSISLSGSQPTAGFFDGPVTATVTLGTGAVAPVSYVLDGGPSTPLPANDEVVVSGDGEHTLEVSDSSGDTASSSFDIDTLGPTVSSATTPAATANGWVPGAFTGSNGTTSSGSELEVDVTDAGAPVTSVTFNESGAQTASGTLSGASLSLPLDLPLTANGATTIALTATDAAGLSSTASVTVDVDAEAPAVQCTVPNGSGWLDHNVSVPCTVTDNESGIAPGPALYSSFSSSAASFTLSTSVAPGQASSAAMTPGATVCSAVGDCTRVGPFGPFEVDLSPPVVVITTPGNRASYTAGTKVAAAYTCSDTGSGVASCTGTVADGADINTAKAGTYTFSVTAADKAGNTTTSQVTYTVTPCGQNCQGQQ